MDTQRFVWMRALELIGELAVRCGQQEIAAQAAEVARELAEAPKPDENGG